MKYSLMLSIATISIFAVSTYAMENEPTNPKTMTLQERMERSRQPLTTKQTEQGRIKATSADVNTQNIEEFNAEQQPKEQKKRWYHFGRK